jgi:3'(2'), 5'-bisphosphate nucleotidase
VIQRTRTTCQARAQPIRFAARITWFASFWSWCEVQSSPASDPRFRHELAPFAARLDELTSLVARAARVILAIDPSRAKPRKKPDHTPVTAADEAAQAVVLEGLSRLFPALPAICEESPKLPDQVGSCFALIDPLDGTREYLDGSDEFTVNLAIGVNGVAALGIIAAPALGRLWRGIVGEGAARLSLDGAGGSDRIEAIHTRASPAASMRVLVSRSHLDPDTSALLARLRTAATVPCGSSVKFCRLAEGQADLYPRLAPTFEWDIAAGDAILSAAGGLMVDPAGTALRYGRLQGGIRVPAFLAFGSPELYEELRADLAAHNESRPSGLT